jgi:hypothetical protein
VEYDKKDTDHALDIFSLFDDPDLDSLQPSLPTQAKTLAVPSRSLHLANIEHLCEEIKDSCCNQIDRQLYSNYGDCYL